MVEEVSVQAQEDPLLVAKGGVHPEHHHEDQSAEAQREIAVIEVSAEVL